MKKLLFKLLGLVNDVTKMVTECLKAKKLLYDRTFYVFIRLKNLLSVFWSFFGVTDWDAVSTQKVCLGK